jgi:hypothetical protein
MYRPANVPVTVVYTTVTFPKTLASGGNSFSLNRCVILAEFDSLVQTQVQEKTIEACAMGGWCTKTMTECACSNER